MSTNAARKVELMSAEEQAISPGFKAAQDFANSKALETLREWIVEQEAVLAAAEAERIRTADAARDSAA